MTLKRTVKAFVRWGETHYVAECMDISGVTQGKTLDETMANLREAIELYFEGEDPEESGFTSDPTILVTLELEPAHA